MTIDDLIPWSDVLATTREALRADLGPRLARDGYHLADAELVAIGDELARSITQTISVMAVPVNVGDLEIAALRQKLAALERERAEVIAMLDAGERDRKRLIDNRRRWDWIESAPLNNPVDAPNAPKDKP